MKKSYLYLVIISALVFAFSLTMMFVLNNNRPLIEDSHLVLYYIVKVLVLVSLVVAPLYVLGTKKEITSAVVTLGGALILQLYPLLLRLWLLKASSTTWPIAVTFIVFIVYIGLCLVFDIYRGIATVSHENLKGKEIPVKDEASYNDANGKFVGKKPGNK